MTAPIRIAAVSYLNTKPLLHGLNEAHIRDRFELSLAYPRRIAGMLEEGRVDVGLVPVAAIPGISGAEIISGYGIGADGPVASVGIYSRVPIEEVRQIYLDYQSRTSVRLAQVLIREYWKLDPLWLPAPEDYIERISGQTAGVIIGDRALQNNTRFPFVYDLSEFWKAHTGLPFIFAAWVANKKLPPSFLEDFDAANALGLQHLSEIISANPCPPQDLFKYYTENIRYRLSAGMHRGKDLFLNKISELPPLPGSEAAS